MLRCVTYVSVGGCNGNGSRGVHHSGRNSNLAGSSDHADTDYTCAAGTSTHRAVAAGGVKWHMFDLLADAFQAIVQRVVISASGGQAWLFYERDSGMTMVGRDRWRWKSQVATARFVVIVGWGTGKFQLG